MNLADKHLTVVALILLVGCDGSKATNATNAEAPPAEQRGAANRNVPADVPSLIDILGDTEGDWSLRCRAAAALGATKDPRGAGPLITALADVNSLVRRAAAIALGELNSPEAVEPLIAALHDSDMNVRSAAARSLGQIGDPRARDPLKAAARKENQQLKAAAEEALSKLEHGSGAKD